MNATTPSLRWRDRRGIYRPAGETINPKAYAVGSIDKDGPAKAFITAHHYSASYPAAKFRAGLYQEVPTGTKLVGVAVFSVGMSALTLPKHGEVPADDGIELGRLVLDEEVPANGETFFVARALRLLRAAFPRLRAMLSLSDPLEWVNRDGTVVKRGHVGTIYQALGMRYRGRSTPRTMVLGADGRPLSPRALQKVRSGEQGQGYAIDQLVRAGAARPELEEDARAWLRRVLALPPFSRVRHPGCHSYAMRFDGVDLVGLPYPKMI